MLRVFKIAATFVINLAFLIFMLICFTLLLLGEYRTYSFISRWPACHAQRT